MKANDQIIIENISFQIIINIKKIKKVYMRIKNIDNQYCIVINSFKRLSKKEIEDLVLRHKEAIIKIVTNMEKKINNSDFLILGKSYNKEEVTKEMIEYAYSRISEMFAYYRNVFHKNDTILKFRKMRTRWGVCFINKNYITLTKATLHLPLFLTEYIIIHEFCHFKYPNHSKQFYEYVSKYCPDYKKRKKELKNFSYTLN